MRHSDEPMLETMVQSLDHPMLDPAYQHAQAAHDKIESHEDLCAERYKNIHNSIDSVEKNLSGSIDSVNKSVETIVGILKGFGSLLVATLIAVIGYLAVKMIDSDDARMDRMRADIQASQKL